MGGRSSTYLCPKCNTQFQSDIKSLPEGTVCESCTDRNRNAGLTTYQCPQCKSAFRHESNSLPNGTICDDCKDVNKKNVVYQCHKCQSIFESKIRTLSSQPTCNNCGEKNKERVRLQCKTCDREFFVPAEFPTGKENPDNCNNCAKSLRENLKSGKYLRIQSVKEGKIHSLIFPRENLLAINSQLERSGLHPVAGN